MALVAEKSRERNQTGNRAGFSSGLDPVPDENILEKEENRPCFRLRQSPEIYAAEYAESRIQGGGLSAPS